MARTSTDPVPATPGVQVKTSPTTGVITSITPVAPPLPPGPTPVECLTRAGFAHVRLVEVGIWEGARTPVPRRDINAQLFVDGPYKTSSDAASSAQELLATEYATSGGLYEVSATLQSPFRSTIDTVAACLKSSAPAGATKTPTRAKSGSKKKSTQYSF